jgi:hypothetical protein
MPYRGAIGPRIACAAHAAAEAAGACSHCRVPLCDPCTLYFLADAYCRRCIGAARRARTLRVVGGAGAVLALLLVGSGVMLAALPRHARAHFQPSCALTRIVQAQHDASCTPADRWLAKADDALRSGRPYAALHDVGRSERECGGFEPERDRIYAESYAQIGDRFAAIASAVQYVEETHGTFASCAILTAVNGRIDSHRLHPLCPVPDVY